MNTEDLDKDYKNKLIQRDYLVLKVLLQLDEKLHRLLGKI